MFIFNVFLLLQFCVFSEWTQWEDEGCDNLCGNGTKTFTRHYLEGSADSEDGFVDPKNCEKEGESDTKNETCVFGRCDCKFTFCFTI